LHAGDGQLHPLREHTVTGLIAAVQPQDPLISQTANRYKAKSPQAQAAMVPTPSHVG